MFGFPKKKISPKGIKALTQVPGRSQMCGSGWTGDRCTKALGHPGRHSND